MDKNNSNLSREEVDRLLGMKQNKRLATSEEELTTNNSHGRPYKETKFIMFSLNLFKLAVILTHGLIFIIATLIGLAGGYNISTPDPNRTYGVWFTAIVIFDILVIFSIFVQLRVKRFGYC